MTQLITTTRLTAAAASSFVASGLARAADRGYVSTELREPIPAPVEALTMPAAWLLTSVQAPGV
jgi:hypothetical protein